MIISLFMCPFKISMKALSLIMTFMSLFWVVLLIAVIVLIAVYWNKIYGFYIDTKEQIDNIVNIINSMRRKIEELIVKVDELSNK
jgi:uncharacterized membrane protein